MTLLARIGMRLMRLRLMMMKSHFLKRCSLSERLKICFDFLVNAIFLSNQPNCKSLGGNGKSMVSLVFGYVLFAVAMDFFCV